MREIPITKVWIEDDDVKAVLEPLRTGWLVQGPCVAEFEDRFARYTGASYAVATSSCTSALHISLAAAGVRPHDEVVVPAFTWVATANAVEYLGARPVFCDIDLDTFNVDVDRLADLITERTRAIVPVHLFGLAADMYPIRRLARWHDLRIVEDAACGLGATYHGTHVGATSSFACFSFHPRKAITTGEGGMIVTSSEESAALCRSLRDHGADRSGSRRDEQAERLLLPSYDRLGYNYRMMDLQGALGSAQMAKADAVRKRRIERARRYDELLESVAWLRRPVVPPDRAHAYQSYVCLFQPEAPTRRNAGRLHDGRNELMVELEARGVATRQGTHAVPALGLYAKKYGLEPGDFPNAWLADRLSLALPLYPQMTDAEQDYVVEQLESAYASTSAGRRSRAAAA